MGINSRGFCRNSTTTAHLPLEVFDINGIIRYMGSRRSLRDSPSLTDLVIQSQIAAAAGEIGKPVPNRDEAEPCVELAQVQHSRNTAGNTVENAVVGKVVAASR